MKHNHDFFAPQLQTHKNIHTQKNSKMNLRRNTRTNEKVVYR